MTAPIDKTAIRNAATVVLLRDADTRPKVLMGQRGARAAFMPNKFVFPGGAVDAADAHVPLAQSISPSCEARLAEQTDATLAVALQIAAIREVWEETGLVLGTPGHWPDAPEDWQSYAATGHLPSAAAFRFVFRAITPPGRPRRFDARFFLADAAEIQGDADDFTHASDELSALQWIALEDARSFDLPFITEVVLAEVANLHNGADQPDGVPFFHNDDEETLFLRLNGARPLD